MRPSLLATLPMESHNYLIDLYGLDKAKLDVGTRMLSTSISGALGLGDSTDGKEELYRLLSGANELLRRGNVSSMREIEGRGTGSIESILSKVPSGISARKRHDTELSRFFLASIMPILKGEAIALGISLDEDKRSRWQGITLEDFLRKFPSAHVYFELNHLRDKERGMSAVVNDDYDLSFLSYAIPYASIVVTERGWAEAARRLRFHELYNSKVISVTEMDRLDDMLP